MSRTAGSQLGHDRPVNHVALVPSGDGGSVLRIGRRASEAHLGSQDLIRFAGYADTQGFTVSSFTVADAHLSPLSGPAQAETSARMVDVLKTWGSGELETAMSDDFDGLYVVGVTVAENSTAQPISVQRRGQVVTPIPREAEKLLASAWQELKLS